MHEIPLRCSVSKGEISIRITYQFWISQIGTRTLWISNQGYSVTCIVLKPNPSIKYYSQKICNIIKMVNTVAVKHWRARMNWEKIPENTYTLKRRKACVKTGTGKRRRVTLNYTVTRDTQIKNFGIQQYVIFELSWKKWGVVKSMGISKKSLTTGHVSVTVLIVCWPTFTNMALTSCCQLSKIDVLRADLCGKWMLYISDNLQLQFLVFCE